MFTLGNTLSMRLIDSLTIVLYTLIFLDTIKDKNVTHFSHFFNLCQK